MTQTIINRAREALAILNTMADGYVATVSNRANENKAWQKRDKAVRTVQAALDLATSLEQGNLSSLSDDQILAVHDASHREMLARHGTPNRQIVAEVQIADLQAEVTRLTGELAQERLSKLEYAAKVAENVKSAWIAEHGDIETRNAALEAALKPFADFIGPKAPPDNFPLTQGSPMARGQLNFGHLRAARQALGDSNDR